MNVVAGSGSYPVIIGYDILHLLIEDTGFQKCDKCAFFINETVYHIHKKKIEKCIQQSAKVDIFMVSDGEQCKQYKNAERYLSQLLEKGYTRNSLIVAIGGGVTGDFAGFVAAIYMRGITIIQIPTTLLAMVDSSIGGKVAVNLSAGKNMVGAFYPPVKVITDIAFLETLPGNEMRNGMAECVKHAFIGEKELFELIQSNSIDMLQNIDFLKKLVSLAASFKVSVVSKDEKEGGLRAILNFGHTIAHAIESKMKYERISHGEAVAIGMNIIADISEKIGYITNEEKESIHHIIGKYQLVRSHYDFDARELVAHMKYDKKNKNNTIQFVLLKGIFNPVFGCTVDTHIVEEVISHYM
jgi:3-dehydroquinate synthase